MKILITKKIILIIIDSRLEIVNRLIKEKKEKEKIE